jgi:hypothetical protein
MEIQLALGILNCGRLFKNPATALAKLIYGSQFAEDLYMLLDI